MIPKGTKPRSALWALGVLPLVPFLASMYGIGASTMFLPRDEHPVEALARAAEADFDAMLGRQSRSYAAAVSEYRRRYDMEPPPGFEAWYSYAVARGSPIVDEFDTIHEAIEPFLKMSGREVREAMAEASGVSGIDLWRCEFKGQTGETRCSHPLRSGGHIQETFGRWLENVTGRVPDVEFLVNHLDEPRVMLPGVESTGGDRIRVSKLSRKPIWDVLMRSCPRDGSSASSEVQRATVDIN
ncbi:hypothetical protein VTK56DRAFT_5962 [Thermocarpiscus australiensis]